MASAEYHRQYRKSYWKNNKQVTFVIPIEDFKAVEMRAQKCSRTVGQQLWAESQSYLAGEYIAPDVIESKLDELIRIFRGCANNINQAVHLSNSFGRLVEKKNILVQISKMERDADRLIRSAWKPTE